MACNLNIESITLYNEAKQDTILGLYKWKMLCKAYNTIPLLYLALVKSQQEQYAIWSTPVQTNRWPKAEQLEGSNKNDHTSRKK